MSEEATALGLGGAGQLSFNADPLADKPTPAHHPLCVPGDPPTPGPWDPLLLLVWPSCSQESQGPGEREGGSVSPSLPWKQIQKAQAGFTVPFKEPGGGPAHRLH